MILGFDTLKDILEVVIIPIAIFVIGALLPGMFEAVKTRKFLALIKRELGEMGPRPDKKSNDGKWYQHLKKRFIHEEIFAKISENRDFILSLPPEVSYNTSQLWTHFEKATKPMKPEDLAEHAASWCDYLRAICSFFDHQESRNFYKSVYEPWEQLVLEYYPELREAKRLPPQKLSNHQTKH